MITFNETPKSFAIYLIFVVGIWVQLDASAQWTGKIEAYKYLGSGGEGTFQPLLQVWTPGKWYGEMRYNYEDARTFSCYAGKTWTGGNLVEFSLTPMAGYSVGEFTGASLGINADVEWKDVYFSAQSQYSVSSKTNKDNFLFSWSELGYSLSEHFFTGVSLQYTRTFCQTDFEPGIVSGLSFKNLEIPFYVFKPFSPGRYFVVGLSYEFSLRNRSKGLSLAYK